jgi:hypothetical protein
MKQLCLALLAALFLIGACVDSKQDKTPTSADVLKVYVDNQKRKSADIKQLMPKIRKAFWKFTEADYKEFMSTLDLNKDPDLLKWGNIVGIPVMGLDNSSLFFQKNAHLLADLEAAKKLAYKDLLNLKAVYDERKDEVQMFEAIGKDKSKWKPLKTRKLPKGVIMSTQRSDGYWYFSDFKDSRMSYEVLEPYLVELKSLKFRPHFKQWFESMPLNMVKTMRGTAIYMTTRPGRSYAPTNPVSYGGTPSSVGMKVGVYVDRRNDSAKGTSLNFIHEFGHIFDYVILKGGYGSYRHPYQYTELRKLLSEKRRVFGKGDDKVPNTSYGYMSRYSKTNAQECVAVHFRFYILNREEFLTKAEKEKEEGHPELMQKFRFMETALSKSPINTQNLSVVYLKKVEPEIKKYLAKEV